MTLTVDRSDGTIPGMLDELLNADGTFKLGAYRRPPPRKGGAARTGPAGGNFYQGAGPQGRDTQTQTGVINGGNTCYQNVTIRLIMSSHPVLERLLELREGEFPEGGIGLPRPLFDLISAIQARHFVESKTLLKLVWDLLGNKDRAWGPGNQQDMEEFLTSWVIPEMEGVFASWEHKTIDEVGIGMSFTADCLVLTFSTGSLPRLQRNNSKRANADIQQLTCDTQHKGRPDELEASVQRLADRCTIH